MGVPRKIGRLELSPQCAFPERFRFLKATLKLNVEQEKCEKFEEFIERYHGPIGVSIVYSSAYPNNPASMFGHTFLKIESERKSPLIDTGINFAAKTPSDMGMLSFMYRGVMGGYLGMWSMEPYFKKVNEYINTESRDLWEYELSLSKEETLRLLAHLWELEVTSNFDYYFFDENCSYQILRAIEAIRLDWSLTQHKIYFIPGESLKNIADNLGAIREVRFRPSLYHKLQMHFSNLNTQDRKKYLQITQGIVPDIENEKVSAAAIDAALTYFLFLKAKKKARWTEKDQSLENQSLNLRKKLDAPVTEVPIPENLLKSRPDHGHDAYSLHISSGWLEQKLDREGVAGRLKLRSAYHDLMANDSGFSPFTEIQFPWVELQYHEDRFQIQELGFLSTTSLFPISAVDRKKSWRVEASLERERAMECQNCLIPHIEVGGGATIGTTAQRLYTLGVGRAELSSSLESGYRLRPGVQTGWIWSPTEVLKTRLSGSILWNALPKSAQERVFEIKWDHSLNLSRNQELRQISLWTYTDRLKEPSWIDLRLEWILYFR